MLNNCAVQHCLAVFTSRPASVRRRVGSIKTYSQAPWGCAIGRNVLVHHLDPLLTADFQATLSNVSWQLREWEINGDPTDPRVLMVGLLAQPEKGLVRPDDVAGVCLPTASSQGDTNNNRENLEKLRNPCNSQVKQLAVQHRGHSHYEQVAPRHKRADTENSPKKKKKNEKLRSGVKIVCRVAWNSAENVPETARCACLARVISKCGLFVSPSRYNIDVHRSRRRRLFGAVRCWFFFKWRTTKEEWQRKTRTSTNITCFAFLLCLGYLPLCCSWLWFILVFVKKKHMNNKRTAANWKLKHLVVSFQDKVKNKKTKRCIFRFYLLALSFWIKQTLTTFFSNNKFQNAIFAKRKKQQKDDLSFKCLSKTIKSFWPK